ncbi:alpha/beta hydrolase [Streptomyces gamaensis]|uniref:Alpha/beta hydrolase n=1 Tax=Streptomyces gamaensis TaxID=1763542 RepID=A0ABW0Z1M7_9ACTN
MNDSSAIAVSAGRTRRLLAALVVAVLTVTYATQAHAAPRDRQPPGAAGAEARWTDCPDQPGLLCTTLSVPVDWQAADTQGTTSTTDAARVDLPVVKRPASDPGRRLGALVINYGGPGEAHAQQLLWDAGPFAALGERFDLVAFDTRDTLLRCGENLVVHADRMPVVLDSRTAHDERVRFNRALADSCRKASGALFDHVDAVSIARDMEALRVLLKEPQLNFYGISYGTLIGQMYAEHYPRNVRTMVLDSVVDHSLRPESLIASAAQAQEATYRAAARWCARTTSCALHGQDVDALLDRLFTAAEEGRLTDGDDPVDVNALLKRTYLGNQTEEDWPGWFSLLTSLTVHDRPVGPAPRPELPPTPGDPVPESRPTPLICADWDFGPDGPDRSAALWAAGRKAAPHTRGNTWYQEWSARCAGWPRPASNPQHAPHAPDLPPVLLVNATLDPATSHDWATGVSRQLPGSRLLTYQGAGHGILTVGGTCPAEAVSRYLTTTELPPAGATCPGVRTP